MELRACVDALKPQLLSTLRQNIRIPSVQGDVEVPVRFDVAEVYDEGGSLRISYIENAFI